MQSLGASLLLLASAAQAQTAPLPPPALQPLEAVSPVAPAASAASAAAPALKRRRVAGPGSEPAGTRISADEDTRIEETLDEQGQVRRIQVQPRGGRAYEVLPPRPELQNGLPKAAGQRVWTLRRF